MSRDTTARIETQLDNNTESQLSLVERQTTILEAASRPLGPFDAEIVSQLESASASDGIDYRTHIGIATDMVLIGDEAAARRSGRWQPPPTAAS